MVFNFDKEFFVQTPDDQPISAQMLSDVGKSVTHMDWDMNDLTDSTASFRVARNRVEMKQLASGRNESFFELTSHKKQSDAQ